MGTIYWDCRDDSSGSNASELECINDPLILKVKLPFTDYLSFLDYVRFLRASKFLGWYQNDPIQNRVSDNRSLFQRTSSWYDNPKFSDFVTEHLRRYRRSRSTNDLYDLVVEYASSVAFISRSARSEARAVAPTSMLLSGSSTSVASSYQSKASLRSARSEALAVAPTSMLLSGSSTSVASSFQSKASLHPSLSKGLLRCERNNGYLDISFSEDDNPIKLYSATSRKIGSSSADYTYVFLSQVGEFIGKMNVFTSIVLRPDHTRCTETEFVLYGAPREDRSKEVQSTKQKGFSEKVMGIFRPNRKPNPQISCIDEAGDSLCNLEVAAIVVESTHLDGKREAAVGGWGLKFLEKVSAEHTATSTRPHRRRVNVLIPAGIHGGTTTGNGSNVLTSLIERWRTGHCDCGGWDLGCPLTVLYDAESVEDASENGKTVDLFFEGTRQGEPHLRMTNTSKGLYTLHFQRSLSPLQAFAVGVAIVHTQTPALCHQL